MRVVRCRSLRLLAFSSSLHVATEWSLACSGAQDAIRVKAQTSDDPSKLLVDILIANHYLAFIDLFLAELWLPRDWHRA